MNETASGLKRLHALHTEVAEVRERLERGPRQVRARRKRVETKRAEVEQLRAKLLALQKSRDEKNLQLASNESKLEGLQVKLNQAANNREFDAFKGQIEADRVATSVLEDEILETLERIDRTRATIAEAETDRDAAVTEADEFAVTVDEQAEVLAGRVTELEGKLKEAERIIPGELMGDYRRLVIAHGATALAPVEGRACTVCSTTIAPQQRIDLNMGKFVHCRACGRLLYRGDGE